MASVVSLFHPVRSQHGTQTSAVVILAEVDGEQVGEALKDGMPVKGLGTGAMGQGWHPLST